MARVVLVAALAALTLLAAGCGNTPAAGDAEPDQAGSAEQGGEGTPPALGMCAEGVTDCVDVVVVDPGEVPSGFDADAEQEQAQALLGLAEDELGEAVRVSRRGTEQMMLTEDYVLGRDTVELDEDAAGVYRVVRVVVELPEGPIVFEN